MLQTLNPLPKSLPPPRGSVTRHGATASTGLPRWLLPALHRAGMATLAEQAEGLLLLAPSDAALQEHLRAQALSLDDWLLDAARPRQLLLDHLLQDSAAAELCGADQPQSTLGGRTVWLSAAGRSGALRVSAGNGIDAMATGLPQRCGSLQLLCIDRVLASPQGSLLDLLATEPGHELLLQALRTSGLEVLLRAPGPFTLLAPQDGGWHALASRLGLPLPQLLSDPALLRRVLELQLIPGRWLSHELPWGSQLHSAGGLSLHCSALGLIGCHCQAQPLLVGSDRQASNGVLHRLAEPLAPCSLRVA